MAGVAGHLAVALEIFLIDGEHHLHHLPRNVLGLLLIFIERALNMAEGTFNAEC